MKIRLLQNIGNREFLAGAIVDKEMNPSVKWQLVKDGKAEVVDVPKKEKVNYGKSKR